MPAYPWLRWGQDQCQPGSHETHPMGEKDAQSTSQGEHPQSSKPQGLLSRGCAPIPPASTTDQNSSEETDLGASTPPTREQTHHRQGGDSCRATGKLPSTSRAGSGHSNSNPKSIKGVRAQAPGPTSPPRGQTPGARGTINRILQAAERKPQAQKISQNEMKTEKEICCRERTQIKTYKNN